MSEGRSVDPTREQERLSPKFAQPDNEFQRKIDEPVTRPTRHSIDLPISDRVPNKFISDANKIPSGGTNERRVTENASFQPFSPFFASFVLEWNVKPALNQIPRLPERYRYR